ncbi:MAG: putative heme-binding domain-containing protein [Paracoccaceae bacterium]|jgi:putative heme-binding domain-containing protein
MTKLPLLCCAFAGAVSLAVLAPRADALRTLAPQVQANPEPVPAWIWSAEDVGDDEVVLRKTFELTGESLENAVLRGSCDNHMAVTLNGQTVVTHGSWNRVTRTKVSGALVRGTNTLEVRARNEGGPAGLALMLDVGGQRMVVTDASWQAATPDDARADRWSAVTVFGDVGDATLPWSAEVRLSSFGIRSEEARKPRTQPVRPATDLHLLDGFEAELLYEVPRSAQGSWVSITTDDRGRLYASDQAGSGIFRITPAALGEPGAVTTVETLDVDVSGAQGLCWAFDSLYANVYNQGLWRMRDTDGDDRLDSAEHILPFVGGGEHGGHAVMPTRDGTGIYFIAGNHTPIPDFQGSRAPSNWAEDLLLPRLWDASGHAVGKLAPAGWIARCDPDGQNVEILSNGYRNQYDIALNADGEMFTYDADMEYDQGLPWYRPTRVCHVTSGSEYGWRSGTGKWPAYYEDSLPPVINIGPGSPTGITFGTGTAFPQRYQDALYLLDWTFGTIYAIHLDADGSSYTGTKEEFIWAKPLPVTDTVVGMDGALYFTVGGRGTQSALYRVVYRGDEATTTVAQEDDGADARSLRAELEAHHGHVSPGAVEAAWPHLASEDRFLRFAARIAVENQPVNAWRARALGETRPQALVTGLVALARQGEPSDLPAIAAALGRLDLATLPEPVLLGALRAYTLAFTRLGQPHETLRQEVLTVLEPLFPSTSNAVGAEAAALLVFLRSPAVVEQALTLMGQDTPTELPPWADLIQRNDTYGSPIARMLANMPPLQDIQYALTLRNATEGWTLPLREKYFRFFPEAAQHPGGNSYSGFLDNIRMDAMDLLTVEEERSLAGVLDLPLVAPITFDVTPPEGPGHEWTIADAMKVLGSESKGRDFQRGENLFHATSCSACHRLNGVGGAIGPDLTTVANKFSVADLLEAIVEPSKIISDQYSSHIVADSDGQIAEGIMVEEGDEIVVYPRDPAAEAAVFTRADVTAIKKSSLSQMPVGLLNELNAEEVKDLVAYLLSGGDKNAEVFR